MKSHIWTSLMVLLLGVGAWAAPAAAQAQGTSSPRVISVSGEGLVRVQPDKAVLRFGIVTVADTPEEARRRNAEAAAATMNAVRALGIPERKIQLEVLRLQPRREYNEEKRRYDELGYEAVRQVVAELEDLEKLPELVATVVEKGANRLESIAYDLKDRDTVRDQALREAVTNARAKAGLIAATLGVELGRVHRVDEQGFSFPRPMMQMAPEYARAAKDMGEAEPAAYAAGEIEVQVNVMAAFEIK